MNIDEHIDWLVRERNVTKYDLHQRETVARIVTEKVNEHKQSRSAQDLHDKGITPAATLGSVQLAEIQKFFSFCAVYNAHRICYSDGVARPLMDGYPFAFGSHTLEAVIRCPHLFEYATHPFHLGVARDYLGCTPTLYSLHAWWSVAGHPAPYTQVVHRDYDDFKFVSLICYLTDVTEENGPHVFWPGTHRADSMEGIKPLILTGPAGTAFMADTYAYHQGMPLKKGRRLAFWARYGLYKNWVYDNDRAGRVQRSLVDGRIVWTEENRYITRLLWEDEK